MFYKSIPAGLIASALFLGASPDSSDRPIYKVIDLGTLGGTFSIGGGINNHDGVNGFAALASGQFHAALWAGGLSIDLGTLGGPNSVSSSQNERGGVAGFSDTSIPDPNGLDFCGLGTHLICGAFVWNHRRVTALPSLRGINAVAFGINNRGQVAGAADDNITDATCMPVGAHEFKPVVWNKERDEEVPTLSPEELPTFSVEELPTFPGDPNGQSGAINDEGQIVGSSGNCTVPRHALLWEHGVMIDLGNLGGMTNNQANNIDNRGHITGFSGIASDPNSNHAFLWEDGFMTDLGVLPGDYSSIGSAVNEERQVVGGSSDIKGNERAFVWEKGFMYDLNDLSPGSPLYLVFANGINSAGDIAGFGVVTGTGPTAGQTHAFLARRVNCDDESHRISECDDAAALRGGTERPAVRLPENLRNMLQKGMGTPRLGYRH
jgi:probable HAF family extracellular repeat protein